MSGIAMPPGDPDALEAAAARLIGAAARWGDLAGATSRQAGSIRAAAEWTGDAADRQEAFHAALSTGIARGEVPLARVAGAVRDYAGYLRVARQRVAAANSAVEMAQATGHPAHASDAADALQAARVALDQLDSEGNRAAATVAAADEDAKGVFSPEGPLRSVIEKVHTALGLSGADGILWALGKGPEAAERFMKDLKGVDGEEEKWLEGLLRGANERGEPWASVLDRWYAKSDAAEAFGKQFVEDTKFLGTVTRSLRMVGAPIAVAGDVSTFLNPSQSGVMGDVDRVVAGVNAFNIAKDGLGAFGGAFGETLGVEALADLSLGPVGVGIAVGTGLYLAGSYAYEHWTGFRDVCNDIGHGTVHVADDIGHGIVHGAESVWHDII